MTQSLVINGKEYLPSNIVAARFRYTSDYIGKLAREEKILGTLINRQWFIEPESLRVFLTQADLAKKMRQEELRLQRKRERLVHEGKTEKHRRADLQHEFVALTEAAVVVVCGLMLGGIGFVATEGGVGAREFLGGAKETVSFIAVSILPTSSFSEAQNTLVAASAEGTWNAPVATEETPLVFASFPEFPERGRTFASSTSEESVSSFSDEVRVIERIGANEVIVPVFKTGDGVREFLLVPVNDDSQYHE